MGESTFDAVYCGICRENDEPYAFTVATIVQHLVDAHGIDPANIVDAPIVDATIATKTRPSAIVKTVDQDTRVGECSDVELLNEVKQRLEGKRDTLPRGPNLEARELSIAVTHIEDAITRTNKAHYLHDGRYAVTDAER